MKTKLMQGAEQRGYLCSGPQLVILGRGTLHNSRKNDKEMNGNPAISREPAETSKILLPGFVCCQVSMSLLVFINC